MGIELRNLKKGDWFTRKPISEPNESQIYIRGHYDAEYKRYEVTHWNDINSTLWLKGDTIVYTDFIF